MVPKAGLVFKSHMNMTVLVTDCVDIRLQVVWTRLNSFQRPYLVTVFLNNKKRLSEERRKAQGCLLLSNFLV